MSKLIDADKLKEILKGWTWDKIAICAIKSIDEQPEVLLSCPKCHGKGTYDVPAFDGDELKGYNPTLCELCNGTGKVTLEFYEELQRGCRR